MSGAGDRGARDAGPIRGIAFDFNGVIVDDENLHCEALCRAFQPYGITLTREIYWDRYLAYDDRGAIERIRLDHPGRVPDQDAEVVMERKIAIYMDLLGDKPPFFPGALEAVRACATAWPLVIVSGARRAEIEAALAIGGIANLFRGIVASEDVAVSKPDPEPYVKGAAILAIPPSAILAVEDSKGGLRSARAAGCRTLAVAHTYSADDLRREADRVLPAIALLTPATIAG